MREEEKFNGPHRVRMPVSLGILLAGAPGAEWDDSAAGAHPRLFITDDGSICKAFGNVFEGNSRGEHEKGVARATPLTSSLSLPDR